MLPGPPYFALNVRLESFSHGSQEAARRVRFPRPSALVAVSASQRYARLLNCIMFLFLKLICVSLAIFPF